MKILVIKLSSLGDLFHTLPAVHNLKSGLEAEIDWVTQSEYVELVRCFSDVHRVIPFHRHAFFSNLSTFLRELRRERYDLIVLDTPPSRNALHFLEAPGRITRFLDGRVFRFFIPGDDSLLKKATSKVLDKVMDAGKYLYKIKKSA